jgi:hypothetical protein
MGTGNLGLIKAKSTKSPHNPTADENDSYYRNPPRRSSTVKDSRKSYGKPKEATPTTTSHRPDNGR